MTVAPEHRRPPRPQWFACPSCCRVVAGLAWIEYCRGMATIGPERRCSMCLDRLREGGGATDLREFVWDVRVLDVIGDFEEVAR